MFFLQRSRAVGLVAAGDTRVSVLPQRGDSQLYRLMETLAVLESDGELRFADVIRLETRGIPKGSTVVLISPSGEISLLDPLRLLHRSGLFPVLIHLARETFGGPASEWDLADAARRLGIPGYSLRCGDPIEKSLWERSPRPLWAA